MKKINLKTGFVIIAIYEILYLVYAELRYGINEVLMYYHTYKLFMWTVIVPVAAIVIYFLIMWASKKKQ